jgi:hypothetical protein
MISAIRCDNCVITTPSLPGLPHSDGFLWQSAVKHNNGVFKTIKPSG